MFRCPTCIAVLPDPKAHRCPSCGQNLRRRPPRLLGSGSGVLTAPTLRSRSAAAAQSRTTRVDPATLPQPAVAPPPSAPAPSEADTPPAASVAPEAPAPPAVSAPPAPPEAHEPGSNGHLLDESFHAAGGNGNTPDTLLAPSGPTDQALDTCFVPGRHADAATPDRKNGTASRATTPPPTDPPTPVTSEAPDPEPVATRAAPVAGTTASAAAEPGPLPGREPDGEEHGVIATAERLESPWLTDLRRAWDPPDPTLQPMRRRRWWDDVRESVRDWLG